MSYWPVPQSIPQGIPQSGNQGSFWENRGDRHHAGVDLYAPPRSDVLSIEDGIVIKVDIFTTPEILSYWNTTYSILILNSTNIYMRYAELGTVLVSENEKVNAGQVIGLVGLVLNKEKIDQNSPPYIQKLKQANLPSMLHIEMYQTQPPLEEKYLGGNYFSDIQPSSLLDPTHYLESVMLSI